ncbi:MAG: ABC transporter permease, partial [Pseudobutyrivibrio sp.]|nr:ABC transporter permease [Pseudobutyrivibrio sp.]
GNGFDVSVLNRYQCGRMKGKTTRYDDFFDYITYHKLSDESNVLYKKMKDDREIPGKNNWSDFENSIAELYENGLATPQKLEQCIDEFQNYFTRFLNEVVDTETLLALNEDAKEKKLAIQSLGHFLGDLHIPSVKLSSNADHYDLFYFVFANFNYTALLDNYLYLDKNQFDPHFWPYADRNFQFYLDQVLYTGTSYSSYVLSEVIHPHGIQDAPRSILFGIDLPEYSRGRSSEKRLVKSYWAQYDAKYKSYFDEAELFIIYGMSMGKTDGWWMDKIFDAIILRDADLIIYKYGTDKEDFVKDQFLLACTRHISASDTDKEKVKKNIVVVTFEENNTYFLGLEKK